MADDSDMSAGGTGFRAVLSTEAAMGQQLLEQIARNQVIIITPWNRCEDPFVSMPRERERTTQDE
jgi:hypothetical protein